MIHSRQNQRVKDIRRLRRCKGDHLLLEGPHLVTEAIEAGLGFDEILASPEFLSSPAGRVLEPLLPRLATEVSEELLRQLGDADSPQGVLAVARMPRGDAGALPLHPGGTYLYLAGLQDPGNLGALARVAEASGAAALALSPGTVHANHPRALRASAGSLLRLPVAVEVELEQLQARLDPLVPQWLALAPRGGEDLYRAELSGTLVLVLGAEGPGLPEELAERCQRRITIPLAAPVESLNATVAAALVLFEIRRRHLK
ncbi:MAG TPA: RNA methyltransferase [Thermoanaerobaculia bacterium]|nr:RNA methyltransferase [Thermoanaerobaculia bacterium]